MARARDGGPLCGPVSPALWSEYKTIVCVSPPELPGLHPSCPRLSLCPPACRRLGPECQSRLLIPARNSAGALDSLPHLIVITNLPRATDEDPPEIKSPTHGSSTACGSQSEDQPPLTNFPHLLTQYRAGSCISPFGLL